jgi:hypothetical protein
MQTAMLLTQQKPTQTDRLPKALLLKAVGEVREGLPGSTLERGMREEKRQEPGRPRRLLLRLMMRFSRSHGIRLVSPHTAKARNW